MSLLNTLCQLYSVPMPEMTVLHPPLLYLPHNSWLPCPTDAPPPPPHILLSLLLSLPHLRCASCCIETSALQGKLLCRCRRLWESLCICCGMPGPHYGGGGGARRKVSQENIALQKGNKVAHISPQNRLVSAPRHLVTEALCASGFDYFFLIGAETARSRSGISKVKTFYAGKKIPGQITQGRNPLLLYTLLLFLPHLSVPNLLSGPVHSTGSCSTGIRGFCIVSESMGVIRACVLCAQTIIIR